MSLLEIVAFKVYDIDRDGFISNGELYLVLKQMVGSNLKVSVLVHDIMSKGGSRTESSDPARYRTSNYNRS